ncbi:MAG: hypothetical protein C0183_01205 [Roseiflexus castenholzii]|uniref:hypothetical protein n=1 Tax=Roseiflexus castenholzii TaxID=120962 RepID=UPI000CB89FEB|nr:MAG: hypothetical protein C0183_01205 [Roseiflexus castenholzii]
MIDHQPTAQTWKRGAAVWGLWLLVLGLAAIVIYAIWWRAFFEIYYVWLSLGDATRLVYELTMIILTIGMVTWIAIGEPYLVAGARANRLMRRFWYVAIPLLIAGAIGLIIPMI